MAEIDRYTPRSGRAYGEGDVVHNEADLLAQLVASAAAAAGATAVTSYNVVLTVANTEYSPVLPADTKAVAISVQDGLTTENYRVAFVTGKVATPTAPYIKRYCDAELSIDGLDLTTKTIYFACSGTARVAQILVTT